MPSTLAVLAKYGATPINRQARNALSYKKKAGKKGAKKNRAATNVRRPAKPGMVLCPECSAPVSVRRLQRHLRKVHGPKLSADRKTVSVDSTAVPPVGTARAGKPSVAVHRLAKTNLLQPPSSTRKASALPHHVASALAAQQRQASVIEKVKQPYLARVKKRQEVFLRAKARANKQASRLAAEAAQKRFNALKTAFLNRSISRAQLDEFWTFQRELKSFPEIRSSLFQQLTKEVDLVSRIAPTPQKPQVRKNEICPACGGDGGAGGACYKCDGTGWL